MPDTTQQVIAGVYTVLGRPSQQKLAYQDVLERLNDVLRGFVQDMDLGGRDQRTETVPVTVDEDDIDYLVRLPNVPDYEPVALEYGLTSSGAQAWREVILSPYSARSRHFNQPDVAGSFYGSASLQEGMKLWLNISPAQLAGIEWRLTYRQPLLAIVQMGEKPPIPSNFMPMLKLATALACVSLVNDKTEEWRDWKKESLPLLVAEFRTWFNEEGTGRWQLYLERSLEPSIQPLPRFDAFRRRGKVNPRAYLPIQ